MKTNVTKLLMLYFLSTGLSGALAQSVVIPSGSNATGTGGSASYSVGQIAYTVATGTNGSANQGIQQPYDFLYVGFDKNTDISLHLSVYPNPTLSKVTLNIGLRDPESLFYQLYDINGKLLNTERIKSDLTPIPMENLPKAVYILKVYDEKSLQRTIKIIKN
jgi:hypothetical protein